MSKSNMKKLTFIMFSIVLFFISTGVYAKDLNISIEDVKVVEKNSGVAVSDTNFSNDTLTSNINFSNQNDYVVFEVELKNNSDKKYKALGITDNNTLDNIEITYDFDENVNPNESYKFKVKVLYKEKLVNQDSITLNDLIISLNLMDESGNTSSVVINNPVTGDGILHYLVLLIISKTGLYFIKKKNRFKINNTKIKVGTFILLFAVVILPFCVFAVEKYTLNLKIKGIVLESEYLDYTVSFNTNGGNSIESRTVTYGQQIGELPTGEKEGYNFNGWKDQNGNTVTNTTKVTKELQLTADFSLVEYSITYDLNHGKVTPTNANPTKYTIEDEIELVNPTRKGYTFAGWSIGNSEEKYTTIRILYETGAKTYKANWSKNEDTTYTVINKYEKLDGTYEIVEDEQHGPTDTEVTAPFSPKTGFDNPEPQQVTISGEGDSTVTYIYKRHEYRLTVNEDVETTFTNPTYPYETEITITAKDKANYEFEKWSNGETNKTITFSITEDTNIYPIYTTNKYTITFNTNGGTTDTESINVNVGEAIGTLPIPTPPTGKVFDGWYTDLTGGIEVTSTYVPNADIEIYARYNSTYTVTFDTDGGSTVASQTVNHGGVATKPLTDPTKTGYTFDDWYTDNTYTTKFDFDTPITSDTTIYAHFEELKVCANNENITRLSENTCSNNENITVGDGIVCKRAVKLHEETCSQTNGTRFCSGAGYTTSGSKGTSTITYGSCGTSGTLSSGDAFTCDVNGDGDFDELTERFYYVSDYYDTSAKEFDDSTAVLIYYNNVTSGVSCNKNTYAYNYEDLNYRGPRDLIKQLPKTTQWNNISLKNTSRQILDQNGSSSRSGGTLPIYSYSGYAARFLTAKELMVACNLSVIGNITLGELDSCNYLMENTIYANPYSIALKYGSWLETPSSYNTYHVWTISGYERSVNHGSAQRQADYGARPAIEVPKSKIEYGASSTYTVTLNANGGSVNPTSITVNIGDAIGTLPTPTAPTGKSFTGWYTELTGGIEVTSSYIPNNNITIYAHFEELKVCADNENITRLSENTCSNNENITIGDGIVCKRAVKLHEETCSQTSTSGYCSGAGYTTSGSKGTSTITYGSCGTSGTLSSGDAFTCDVNGDGKFNELTERFYYVSDYYDTSAKEFDASTAVLIYYNNVKSGVSCNKNTYAYSTKADIQTVDPSRTSYDNWHGPVTLIKQLPTTTQWSNVSLKNTERAILAEYNTTHDSATTYGGTLPTNFSYEGYAARFLTAKELMTACNFTEVANGDNVVLDSCNYVMENTQYAKLTIESYGSWLETPDAGWSDRVWHVYASTRGVCSGSAGNYFGVGARPAIEVPKSKIEYGASSTYTVTLNANGGSVNPTSITVNIGDAIGTLPTPTAPTGKSFTGWYTDLTGGIEVTSSYVPNTDIEIYARYNSTYTVSFDAGEGSAVNDIEVEQGNSIGTLPTSTRNGYILEGWYEENTYETKVTSSTIPTGNVTYYAKWEKLKVCADNENITTLSSTTCSNNENITVGDGIVCKRAVKLHEETCSQTDGTYYCSGAGYTESGSKGTSTITYGSCGTSGTLTSGDAFTCDVNGDGDFDELTERFYYVSDYYDTSAKEFDDSTAVLIYYNNVTSGVLCNKNTFAYDSSKENWHGPRTLVSQLPTTSQWSNVSLKSEKRAILAEDQSTHDSPTTTGGTLPTDFSYEGYAARFLTAKELMAGCNLIEVGRRTTGELDSCNYIMENTKFAKSTIGSTGTWLETPNKVDFYSVWYASSYYLSVRSSSTNNANFGGARPTIEVPKNKISY